MKQAQNFVLAETFRPESDVKNFLIVHISKMSASRFYAALSSACIERRGGKEDW